MEEPVFHYDLYMLVENTDNRQLCFMHHGKFIATLLSKYQELMCCEDSELSDEKTTTALVELSIYLRQKSRLPGTGYGLHQCFQPTHT
jgi:hypothetical protein